ncbi:MAG: Magnesium and cobalt efflux protein CorC [Deltaproteobacteria bacterium ADurb.Bin510]|nr:MAG: Magnesium and cobalt efflux protein CorC [Deltaproteobacteria bacterium ADurb.Bin510]
MLESPERVIGTLLLANNFTNTLSSALAGALMLSLVGNEGILYASVVMTILLLVFGDIIPKTIAVHRADELALGLSAPLRMLDWFFSPLVNLLNHMSFAILRLFGFKPQADRLTTGDVESVIAIGHKEGLLQPPKARMLENILELDSVPVRKVMLPLSDMVFLPIESGFEAVVKTVIDENFSRYPVYNEHHDNILGYLHVRDVWRYVEKPESFDLRTCLREAEFVPETKSILSQLIDFQRQHVHIAFVVDEFGNVKGAVTLEDIIEEITGDITDEHDATNLPVVPVGNQSYLVRGNLNLRDLGKYFDIDFPEEYDTLAGLIQSLLDRIPAEGDQVVWQGLSFKVERMRSNRLVRVRVNLEQRPDE